MQRVRRARSEEGKSAEDEEGKERGRIVRRVPCSMAGSPCTR